ncbi:MAG: ABC transporter ATP-binding protein [Clostridiales Family XIII bacterium]|jgi:oligopeptide/dipeptide ABC transporter ATP-binding protein|nr:ABC transporter ATP-binding protein [Clostridiales Family XIII bacterium]
MNEAYIRIENLHKFYPVKGGGDLFGRKTSRKYVRAVNGVSLSMAPGEVLGVIGESGCGKSTLARLLVRLETPTSGDISVGGMSTDRMSKENAKQFRRTVQIIFQNPFDTFTPRDTIEQLLSRPMKLHGICADDEGRRRRCEELLEQGNLRPADDILRRYPHELSGGQLQRISILRAMLLEPRVIVADEPVSMLDVSVRADIINTLLDLSRRRNATVVFISHDIALTRHISDNIAVMYLGRSVEYGPSDAVIKNPMQPYTQALISNCASIDIEHGISSPIRIEGEPPTPIDPGPGCFFANRCPRVKPRCVEAYPETVRVGENHTAACHFL